MRDRRYLSEMLYCLKTIGRKKAKKGIPPTRCRSFTLDTPAPPLLFDSEGLLAQSGKRERESVSTTYTNYASALDFHSDAMDVLSTSPKRGGSGVLHACSLVLFLVLTKKYTIQATCKG